MVLNTIYTFDSLHAISISLCGIYCITCTANSKKYIGSSKDVQRRMRMHKYYAEHENTKLPLLYDEMRLYGLESFMIEILEQCPEKALLEREDYWIKVLHTNTEGYNIRRKTDLRGKKRGEVSFLMHLETYNLFGYIMHKIPRHICGIYCITSLDTGKQYVGRSTDLKMRLRLHRYDSLKHPEFSPELYADMRIYSIERFKVELLEECAEDKLAARERHWLDALGTEHHGYNYYRKDFRHTDVTSNVSLGCVEGAYLVTSTDENYHRQAWEESIARRALKRFREAGESNRG